MTPQRLVPIALVVAVGALVWWSLAGREPGAGAAGADTTTGSADDAVPEEPGQAAEQATLEGARRPQDEADDDDGDGEDAPSAAAAEAPADEDGDQEEDAEEPHGSGAPAAKGAARDDKPVGTLDKEAIQAAIKAVVPRIKACFEDGLKREPDLAGKVVVQFEIEADEDGNGVVNKGEVPESETVSPFFDACVLKEVAGASFPAPKGGGKVTVRYPFQFDPGGGFGGKPPAEGE